MDLQDGDDEEESEFDSENHFVNIKSDDAHCTEALQSEDNDDTAIIEVTEREQETVESGSK